MDSESGKGRERERERVRGVDDVFMGSWKYLYLMMVQGRRGSRRGRGERGQ